jgi:branched-chain amino acid transport system substrate-binding protein
MRPDDHQLIVPIEIASLVKVGSDGISVDVEDTGYGWKTEMRSDVTEAIPPLRCAMQRPGS